MTTLAEELAIGPLAAELAPHVAAGNAALIVAALNDKRFDAYGPIGRAEFAIWCGTTGLRAAIEDHANAPLSPLRSIALTLIDFLRGNVSPAIDFGKAANRQMLAAWVSAGGVTQAQADELLALSLHKVSRAEILGLDITLETVAKG